MGEKFNFSGVKKEDQVDILELDQRIDDFLNQKEDEERFKLYRLTRGVYGQRQTGVQMFRIKIPYGRLTAGQLVRIADIAEKYTNGNLHLTTRQNIQLHYVKLTDSPAIWTELAEGGLTAREACGNTVRNLTASANAGIDPDEPFDVSPYVQAAFEYFLRNPICQDMGRKIKPAFSSSEKDSAYTYFHDFGFIPRIRTIDGQEQRGFKVVIGGGLGAISIVAPTVYEFLEEDLIIPFMEASIRVFDRYGEREKRMKARMKFLIQKIGLEEFLRLVEEEKKAIKNKRVPIDLTSVPTPQPVTAIDLPLVEPINKELYDIWLRTNVFEQKQKGFYAVQLRVRLGNIDSPTARKLAVLVKKFAADDIRLTVNQGILLKFLRSESLPHIYNELSELGLADHGFNTIADITACPGTDTCALGVTNSTGLARQLEKVVLNDYPHLVEESDINIKISGCMNSCGQHMAANIGFHGSSIKKRPLVIPAMQVVIGGGVDPEGKGFVAEKVIKIPTRRIPDALRTLLDGYETEGLEGEYFNDYFRRFGKRHFYDMLKPLSDVTELEEELFFDWGQDEKYRQSIGVGECAGVTLDVVGTIIAEAREKIEFAKQAVENEEWANAIYHTYTSQVIAAKALLLTEDIKCNTHKGIIEDFQAHFVAEGKLLVEGNDFPGQLLSINQNEPSEAFSKSYLSKAKTFITTVIEYRKEQLKEEGGKDKLVIDHYYKA